MKEYTFNHKETEIDKALGISKERVEELQDIVKMLLTYKKMSMGMEAIIALELDELETVFVTSQYSMIMAIRKVSLVRTISIQRSESEPKHPISSLPVVSN